MDQVEETISDDRAGDEQPTTEPRMRWTGRSDGSRRFSKAVATAGGSASGLRRWGSAQQAQKEADAQEQPE